MTATPAPPLLFTTCGFLPEEVGGVEQHTLEVARVLRKIGIQVAFFTRGDRPDLKEGSLYRQEYEGIPITRVVYRWGEARSVRHIYDHESQRPVFARFLAGASPRLVHVHHLSGLGLSCLEEIKAADLPCVMTLHDYWTICPRGQMFHSHLYPCDRVEPVQCAPCIAATWPHLMPSRGGIPLDPAAPGDDRAAVAALHGWIRKMLALPDRLVTASEAAKERIVQFGVPENRIQVIEYGQNLQHFQHITRLSSPRVRFGFVGTFYPSKGGHILLEAFAKLPPGTASLIMAGNAPAFHQDTGYMDRIRGLEAKVPAENPVEILGAYDHGDLPDLLSRIDVLVVPPIWHEAFGLTLREGMLAGCAVVASRVGGLPQAVDEGRNGFTFPAADVETLAVLLQKFVNDRSLAARMGTTESHVRSLDNMVESLLELYGELGVCLP